MTRRYLLWFWLVLGVTPGAYAEGERQSTIRWMSEQYPPYNFVDPQGQASGIVVEILQAIWAETGESPAEIEFLPWARGYARLQREPDTALFSMTYTPERQQKFRFVGPVIETRQVILAPRAAALKIDTPADLNRLKIGVIRDDIGELLLRDLAVTPAAIVRSNLAENLIELLHRGRVDAIAYSYDVALWNMGKLGIEPGAYESVFTLLEGYMGFAFHRDTPPERLHSLQAALEAVQASGADARIRQKYLGGGE